MELNKAYATTAHHAVAETIARRPPSCNCGCGSESGEMRCVRTGCCGEGAHAQTGIPSMVSPGCNTHCMPSRATSARLVHSTSGVSKHESTSQSQPGLSLRMWHIPSLCASAMRTGVTRAVGITAVREPIQRARSAMGLIRSRSRRESTRPLRLHEASGCHTSDLRTRDQ